MLSPVTQRPYITNHQINNEVAAQGYAIVPFLNEEQLTALRNIYNSTHQINKPGFFFSIFNNDKNYRRKIYDETIAAIQTSLSAFFNKYKIGYSGFVVRGPKDEGEFFIHQDPSFVDESKYAPLHIWCPLYDITLDFAPVCVIPKSHKLAEVHRCISIPAPFEDIREQMRPYLKPLTLKAGEVIFLDPRLIHNSLPNQKDHARPVLLVQMFPEEADYCTPYLKNGEIEVYGLPDDYFIANPNFYENVDDRPALGKLHHKSAYSKHSLSFTEFENFCKANGVTAVNYVNSKIVSSEGFITPKA